MNKFISVIVAVYNIEKYIRECVESLIKQETNDFEVILVDDGSTDNSGTICDEYAAMDERIKVIHKENGGLSDARNVGLENAIGKYILFIDGDDYINANAIIGIINDCKEQDCPDVVFLRAYKVYEDSDKIPLDIFMEKKDICGQCQKEVLQVIAKKRKYPASAWSKLIKREMLVATNTAFLYGKKSEDLDWTKKVFFAAQKFGVSDVEYYYYRQNRKGSISNSVRYSNFKDISDVIDSWIQESKRYTNYEREVLLSFAAYEYKILLLLYGRIEIEKKYEAYKWLKEHSYLLKFKKDNQIKAIRLCVIFLGIKNTSKLLNLYMYHD